MDAALIAQLEELASKIHKAKDTTTKEKLRNELFMKMHQHIDGWVKNHLRNRSVFNSNEERLSLCWDCFEFCLNHFNPEKKIPLPSHFYGYTRFFILSWFQSLRRNETRMVPTQGQCEEEQQSDSPLIFYEQIDALRKFREALPDEGYRAIFDDAVMSMAGKPSDKVPYRKSNAYGYYKYCEAKKILKVVIDFLLRM